MGFSVFAQVGMGRPSAAAIFCGKDVMKLPNPDVTAELTLGAIDPTDVVISPILVVNVDIMVLMSVVMVPIMTITTVTGTPTTDGTAAMNSEKKPFTMAMWAVSAICATARVGVMIMYPMVWIKLLTRDIMTWNITE